MGYFLYVYVCSFVVKITSLHVCEASFRNVDLERMERSSVLLSELVAIQQQSYSKTARGELP